MYLESNGLTVAGFLKLLADQQIQPEWVEAEVEETYLDDPVFDHVSIFNFFPDPKRKSIDTMSHVFRRYHTNFEDLAKEHKDMGKIYEHMDEVEKLSKAKDIVTSGSTNYVNEVAQIFGSEDYTNKDNDDHQLEVLEMWENDRLVKVVNRKVIIRDTGNPYHCGKIPFVVGHDIPIPNQFYAWGEIDPIKKIEDMMTDTTNMRLENVVRALLSMWLVNPNTLVDGEEFSTDPGGVIQVTDMNGVKPLEVKDVTASSYKEYELWSQVIQNASGVTDYATGNADPSMNKTLGGVELLQQAANARFKYKLQLFEKLLLEPIGYFYIEHNRQFISEERYMMIADQPFRIGPNDLRAAKGSLDLVVQSGTEAFVSEQTEITKWSTIMDRWGKPPFANMAPEADDEAAKRFLRAMQINDPETLTKRLAPQVVPGAPGSMPNGAVPGNPGVMPGEAPPPSKGTIDEVQDEEVSPAEQA